VWHKRIGDQDKQRPRIKCLLQASYGRLLGVKGEDRRTLCHESAPCGPSCSCMQTDQFNSAQWWIQTMLEKVEKVLT
jgi:hypothetical protein